MMRKMMTISLLPFLLLFLTTTEAFADKAPKKLICSVTINKSSDWNDFDVTIKMYNVNTQQVIASYQLPKSTKDTPGVNTITQNFDCYKYPLVTFKANFSPAIWENDANMQYIANKIWSFSEQTFVTPTEKTKTTAIVNFPDDFAGLPAPIRNLD